MNISGGFKSAVEAVSDALTVSKNQIKMLAATAAVATGLSGNAQNADAALIVDADGDNGFDVTASFEPGPDVIAFDVLSQQRLNGISGTLNLNGFGEFTLVENENFSNAFVLNQPDGAGFGDEVLLVSDFTSVSGGDPDGRLVIDFGGLAGGPTDILDTDDLLTALNAAENGAFPDGGRYRITFNDGQTLGGELDDFIVNKVPEPSTLALVGAGGLATLAVGAAAARTRREENAALAQQAQTFAHTHS
ncbi:MAG: PEP-CTERM sorting domain-containing protein [Alphaproteobacteria bacterium]